jgi:CheY-like chemotaxis protein
MTILVVDDFSPNRRVVVAVMSNEGFRVLEAGDGIEALEICHWTKNRNRGSFFADDQRTGESL